MEEGNDLVHAVRIVAENDGAMKVGAAGRGRPLEAVQRGENARLVPLLGRLGGVRPGPRREFAGVEDRLAALHGDDRFDGGLDTLLRTLLGHLVPPLALWDGEEFRAAGANLIGDTHVLGMVGDRDPVQRPVLFETLAIVHDDFPARGNPEEVVGSQRYPEHSRVEREAGVDVGNAPVDAGWEISARVGRIIGLLGFDFACSLAGGASCAARSERSRRSPARGRRPTDPRELRFAALSFLSWGFLLKTSGQPT